jgi:hypothetical protein
MYIHRRTLVGTKWAVAPTHTHTHTYLHLREDTTDCDCATCSRRSCCRTAGEPVDHVPLLRLQRWVSAGPPPYPPLKLLLANSACSLAPIASSRPRLRSSCGLPAGRRGGPSLSQLLLVISPVILESQFQFSSDSCIFDLGKIPAV